MRIISGYARGRRLKAPSHHLIRPTTDRVRESLFAILGDLSDCVILDGFAGSGALGCESLSRGASFCFFCDPSHDAQRLLAHNIDVIDAEDSSARFKLPLIKALPKLHLPPDVIFLDPPYHKHALLDEALEALADSPMITRGALFVIEQDVDAPEPSHPALVFDETRLYGRTKISFWNRA